MGFMVLSFFLRYLVAAENGGVPGPPVGFLLILLVLHLNEGHQLRAVLALLDLKPLRRPAGIGEPILVGGAFGADNGKDQGVCRAVAVELRGGFGGKFVAGGSCYSCGWGIHCGSCSF